MNQSGLNGMSCQGFVAVAQFFGFGFLTTREPKVIFLGGIGKPQNNLAENSPSW